MLARDDHDSVSLIGRRSFTKSPLAFTGSAGFLVVLLLRIEMIQHAIHGQLCQHNHLLDAQHQIARRAGQGG